MMFCHHNGSFKTTQFWTKQQDEQDTGTGYAE